MKHKIIIIGAAGKQGLEYFQILQTISTVVALVDENMPELIRLYADSEVPIFRSVEEALANTNPSVAVLAVPHHIHFEYSKMLVENGIHVIKEKPFALNLPEAISLKEVAQKNKVAIATTTQRNYTSAFIHLFQNLDKIGDILYFNYELVLNVQSKTSGWRGNFQSSRGGVILDLGYHAIDILVRLFGLPELVQTNYGFKHDEMLFEKLEDSALILLKYKSNNIHGNIVLNRHADKKSESLKIFGKNGSIEVNPTLFKMQVDDECPIEIIEPKNKTNILLMMKTLLGQIDDPLQMEKEMSIHLQNVELIDKIYSSAEDNFLPQSYSKLSKTITQYLNTKKMNISFLTFLRSGVYNG